MKSILLATAGILALNAPVLADDYMQYPAASPYDSIARSYQTGEGVLLFPYDHVFPVRVYTTPPQQPYYNVPPYAVISGN